MLPPVHNGTSASVTFNRSSDAFCRSASFSSATSALSLQSLQLPGCNDGKPALQQKYAEALTFVAECLDTISALGDEVQWLQAELRCRESDTASSSCSLCNASTPRSAASLDTTGDCLAPAGPNLERCSSTLLWGHLSPETWRTEPGPCCANIMAQEAAQGFDQMAPAACDRKQAQEAYDEPMALENPDHEAVEGKWYSALKQFFDSVSPRCKDGAAGAALRSVSWL